MHLKPTLLDRVLDAFREGDLDECMRHVRTLVEAAPQATAPRQLLASLLARTGNGRLALMHYQRLLPLAVARGEVIRSIAFQKQIDEYQRRELHPPVRWAVLQTQLRTKGLPFLSEAPGGVARPWAESQLLALSRPWFERIAAETRVEFLGLEPRTVDVEAGAVWEVLGGRMRWSFALADGRASAEHLAAEGDAIHVDPRLARAVRMTLVPELPVEILCFDAALAHELKVAVSPGRAVAGASAQGFVHDPRALLPTRPLRREDLDEQPRVPTPAAGSEPPRLAPHGDETARPGTPPRDSGDWVEFGVLSLAGPPGKGGDGDARAEDGDTGAPEALVPGDAPPSESDARASEPPPPAVPERERIIELPSLGEQLADMGGDAAGEEPEPDEPEEELDIAPSADPFATPIAGSEPQVERRRHPRMVVSLESRVALLRLSGARVTPVRGQLNDLSTSGLSVRFANHALGASGAALADAVVAVDLGMPGPGGPLRVAAQVRWLEVDAAEDETRIGIEFVLLTEPDRRCIAGTLARAALAAHGAIRRAA